MSTVSFDSHAVERRDGHDVAGACINKLQKPTMSSFTTAEKGVHE